MVERCPICQGSEWGLLRRIALVYRKKKCPDCGTLLKARAGLGFRIWVYAVGSALMQFAGLPVFLLTYSVYSPLIGIVATVALAELVTALGARVEVAKQADVRGWPRTGG